MADLKYDEFITGAAGGMYQPKRKNQWVFEFPDEVGIASIAIKSVGLPNGSFSELTLDYINQKYYFPGKFAWEEISLTLMDYIGDSTSQKLYDWFLANYNPLTGKQAFGANLKKTVNIILLDPEGAELERWVLKGAWPKTFNWGELDYEADDLRTLELAIRYDRPELETKDASPTPDGTFE
jgi:phage tail-like protein